MTTMNQADGIKTPGFRFLLFVGLIAVGLTGNYFKFSILNADFVFGSIFAMLALQLLGLGSGILAAAIISAYTYFAWNHPYAFLTMTAEVAAVGWLINRRRISMVAADSLYWVALGIPVGYLCFHFLSNMPTSNAMFLMTKQAINGVANCVLARLIFTAYSLRSKTPLISIRETVSNLLIFFALFTGLIMLTVGSRTDFAEIDHRIRTGMIQDSRRVTNGIENWLEDRQVPVENLAEMASTISPEQMQVRLDQARASDKNFLRIALLDKEATAIAYSPLVDELGRSTVGKSFADRPYIPELKRKLQPMLSEVIESRFGRPEPVAIMLAPVILNREYDGYLAGTLNMDRIRNVLEMNSVGRDMQYTLEDRHGNVIITSRQDQKAMEPFSRGKGTLNRLDQGISQWIPQLPPKTSTIELWGKSLYIVESPVGKLAEWKLILEEPVAPFQKVLYDRYTIRFSMLLIVVLALLVLAEFLSRRLVSTTELLGVITLDLPAKLASQSPVAWPESAMLETNHLIRNFKEMADSLLAKFAENRQINESLEQLVRERTHELKESQEKLSTAMEIARLGHWDYDVASDLFTFNDHFYKLFHTTAEEVGGYTMSSAEYARRFVYPDDVRLVGEEVRKAIETSDPHYSRQLEHRMLYADGIVGHIIVQFLIVKDAHGRTIKTYGVNQDITERKQLEIERQKFFLLAESSSEFIGMCDLDMNPLYVNPAGRRMVGLPDMAAACRIKVQDYYFPEDQSFIRDEFFPRVLREGQGDVEIRLRHFQTGEPIWMFYYLFAVRDSSGKDLGWATVSRDITERRRAEQVERRLVAAIEQASEGVIITDPEGTIQYVNPGLERMTGYSRNDLMGQTPRILKSGEQDAAFYRQLWETIKSGRIWSGRFTNRKKDGRLYHEDATITPVKDASGKIVNFVAVKRDITEHLQLSQQLLQAQKMEAIGTLAGGVAHDFNNILQVALGYSELILVDEKLPERYRTDVGKIHESARRGADLVQRLLTFSRKTEIKPQPIDLNRRVAELRKMLERTLPKMIDIQLILEEDLLTINADTTQVDQVLMNLAVNARDAMPDGGKMIVETANIILDEEYAKTHLDAKPGSYVLLMVTDTGEGMDKDTVEHIFEPFYTTKESGQGTGLGLAMVLGIVQQHGGLIRCYSEPGHGTAFKIYFPALVAEEELKETVIKTMPRGGSETILLVDDEEMIRDLGSRILTKAGYKVISASNGREALDLYQDRSSEIDLVVLDLIMPEMGGKQFLEALLSLNPSAKVVIASGFSANGSTKDTLAAGAEGFVNKPYDMRQVLGVVREVLDAE